jgi:uncharacterized damage-inducible protein DinB
MNLADVKQLFDYTEWANGLALEAAGHLSDQDLRHDFKISHGSILGTLVHMAGAEWIWLERWHGRSPSGAEAWSLWSTEACPELQILNDRWRELRETRASFINGLDEMRLGQGISFHLLNGDYNSMRLVDQMQHVANHATLHRGQIVGMIRQLGLTPPATDLLFYLRREIPA